MGDGDRSPRGSGKGTPRVSSHSDGEDRQRRESGAGAMVGILKPTSVAAGPFSRPSSGRDSMRSPRSRRKPSMMSSSDGVPSIHFADEAGQKLTENHFVENLHYSEGSVHAQPQTTEACCTIA